MNKLFITGIGGCVGHYLFDVLAEQSDYHLYLLVRDPGKLRFKYADRPNITLINDSLENLPKHADLIKQMDLVIHLAAEWGRHEDNLDQSLAFFDLIDQAVCRKVIYFSTASILGPDNQPIIEAEKFGTPYIRGKYLFYQELPKLKIYPKITTLFPTWVLGGDQRHPYSHASSGIVNLRQWLWLLRFLKADLSFHFIHSRDIALIVDHLLKHDLEPKNFVLGNQLISASQFIKEVCAFYNVKTYFQVPLPLGPIKFLAGRRLNAWDEFCMAKKHFDYQVSNAATFGLSSNVQTVAQVLADLK